MTDNPEIASRTKVPEGTPKGQKKNYTIEVNPTPIPEIPQELKDDADFVFKYLRVILDGSWDNKNISSRMRDGWEFVKRSDYPALEKFPDFAGGELDGVVGIDDLALARLPRWVAIKRQELAHRRAEQQMQHVMSELYADHDPRAPIINESRTQVRRGRGAHFEP